MTAGSARGSPRPAGRCDVHAVPGSWPRPDAASYAALAGVLRRIPDDAVVLLDGLVASTAPEVLVPQASRLRLVVLVHMPLGHDPATMTTPGRGKRAVLSAAASVVTTSAWTRRPLLELYALPGDRVHVAEPGVDAADLAPGTATAGALLCVAAVIPGKGHDVLLDALATVTDLSWQCLCVGSLDRDPAFAEGLRRRVAGRRARRPRELPGAADRSRSRPQLRRRRPAGAGVAGRDVRHGRHRGARPRPAGGREPRSAGCRRPSVTAPTGSRPGLLVPPDDPAALGAALRAWLGDAELRGRLRRAARERRASLSRVVDHHVRPRRRPGGSGRMIVEAIRVSSEWLDLREPADAAARARELVEHARRHLPATGAPVIHDLGCGSGSMGRWLAPLLPGPQHWVLHDRDADLLEVAAADPARPGRRRGRRRRRDAAVRHHPPAPGRSRRREPDHRLGAARPADRRRAGRAGRRLRRGRMPGAADAVGRRSRRAGTGGSAGRARGGRIRRPPAPHDDAAAACSARMPSRPRPSAFRRLGAEVLVRPSPWRLGAAEADLAAEWFSGWVGAACEQQAELAAEVDAYARRRLAQAAAGQLAVTVDHADLLVLPRAGWTARMSRTAWAWARLAGAAATLAVVVWRLGTGPFLDGVRAVDGRALAAAAASAC